MMFSRLVDRAVEMLEEKVLRVGGNHLQLWLLTAGYGMFLSTHDPERTDYHWQACVDRATSLVHRGLGREVQGRHLKSVPELIVHQNHIPDEATAATISTPLSLSMVNLSYQESEIRNWLLKNNSE